MLAVATAIRDKPQMKAGGTGLHQAIDRLTERQRDCLRLVGQGYVSKEIGRKLGISPATVDNHVRAALDTLQVDNRAEAARIFLAHETGQPLTSQPPRLAGADLAAAQPHSAESGHPALREGLIPPMGGSRNELGREARLFAVIRVAVLGLSGLLVLTLGAAAVLWALR